MTVKTGEIFLSSSALRINICSGAALESEGKLHPEVFLYRNTYDRKAGVLGQFPSYSSQCIFPIY